MLLKIANTPLEILDLPPAIASHDENLRCFHTIEKPETIIRLIQNVPDINRFEEQFCLKLNQPYVVVQDGKIIFSFPAGQFVSDGNFEGVDLWFPYQERLDDEDFSRYFWLLLILWGKISVSGGCFLHGAIVTLNGHYVLMLGKSGVGKTTLSRLAVQEGYTMLNEENSFLTWSEDVGPFVHAAPWPGMAGPFACPSGPLSSILFLRHSDRNEVKRLTPFEAGIQLVRNTRMFNWLPHTIPKGIELIDRTVNNVPAYDFGFVPDKTAISAIRDIL